MAQRSPNTRRFVVRRLVVRASARRSSGRYGLKAALRASCLFPVLLIGCGSRNGTKKTFTPLAVVISGDTGGWIVPCGCTANQSGGLPRRGSYLAELRKNTPVLYLDAGGASAGTSPYQQSKFEAILAGERKMQVAAHNLGRSEIAAGADYLIALAASSNTPFVSANTHSATGIAIAPGMRIVSVAGRRIAVVGVVSHRYATSDVIVQDPVASIRSVAAAHPGEFDSLLVLAYLPDEELQQLATAVPEADAIAGGPTGQAMAPRNVGPVLLASATNKGKFIIRLAAPAEGVAWTGQVVQLDQTYLDDPNQIANLDAFLQDLRRRDFTAAESGLVASNLSGVPTDYRIAGAETCARCHPAEQTSWAGSGHAHAWQTLVGKRFDSDPYCMQCHTTGYGLPGGFESRGKSMPLTNVGCESCHGPSAAHVRDPKSHTPFDAMDQCSRCHDHENSPTFNRDLFWQKIRHVNPATTVGSEGTR